MLSKPINLTLLRRTSNNGPHLFDDTVSAIQGILQKAGVPVIVSNNMLAPGGLNIIVGAGIPGTPPIEELRKYIRPDNTIIFNTEQINSDSVLITEEYLQLLSEYAVWDYCSDNIDALRQRKPSAFRCHEFPIVPTSAFSMLPQRLPILRSFNYDFAFYGAINVPRRIAILQKFHQNGFRVKLISGAFGNDLVNQLLDCKAVLNLHAYETGLFEIGRCLRPMALNIPILSETSRFPACVDWAHSGVVFAHTEDFLVQAQMLVNDISTQQSALRRMQRFIADRRWSDLARDILYATMRHLQSN